ncbi:MAG: hypothetical protein U0175_31285 [Caldilineaceae bacterium]
MNSSLPQPQSFILRMWLESNDRSSARPIWRCMLHDLQQDRQIGFSLSEELLAYLRRRIEEQQEGEAE